MCGYALTYLNNRLTNQLTYVDWNKTLMMGPIVDEHGVEQGGVNSSDHYKLYNNDLMRLYRNLVRESTWGMG